MEKNLDKSIALLTAANNNEKGWHNNLVDALLERSSDGDLKKAFEIAIIEAENGDSISQLKVGRMFRDGKGTEKDRSKSLYWLRKSSIKNGWAPVEFIDLLMKGDYKEQAEAFQLCKSLAINKKHWFDRRLALMYKEGHGTKIDLNLAIKHMSRACKESRDRNSILSLIEMLKERQMPGDLELIERLSSEIK